MKPRRASCLYPTVFLKQYVGGSLLFTSIFVFFSLFFYWWYVITEGEQRERFQLAAKTVSKNTHITKKEVGRSV